jgi:hypothetical protein
MVKAFFLVAWYREKKEDRKHNNQSLPLVLVPGYPPQIALSKFSTQQSSIMPASFSPVLPLSESKENDFGMPEARENEGEEEVEDGENGFEKDGCRSVEEDEGSGEEETGRRGMASSLDPPFLLLSEANAERGPGEVDGEGPVTATTGTGNSLGFFVFPTRYSVITPDTCAIF